MTAQLIGHMEEEALVLPVAFQIGRCIDLRKAFKVIGTN
jgi:hypothetical protein